jgi:hypothetical protein
VSETLCLRGRTIGPAQLAQIHQWLADHPQWSRWRLSRELASAWDWRSPTGQLKDIAARDLLQQLEQRGLVRLPVRRSRGGRQSRRGLEPEVVAALVPCEPLCGSLGALQPLRWHRAERGQTQRLRLTQYLARFHYLGCPEPLGQLHYLVEDRQGRDVAVMLFGPAAWKVGPRDRFIGWTDAQRQERLGHLAQHTRFLILPWVEVPHLASHLLAQGLARVAVDWPAQYGRRLWLVETFVERGRFAGTCYRAANWVHLGPTQGRGRNDRANAHARPVKDLYVYALGRDFRARLCV